jgi:PKD repeat protein
MSEAKPAGVTGTVGGWIKAAITSVIGLLSGAFIMYLTPVVSNAIKPAKPIANFAAQASGLTVQFNNRSTGGVQGWWDYGDGSALEPFDPKLESTKHAYPRPGSYNVKLLLSNLIGEESDRTTPVVIDADARPTPEIALFQLIALDPRERAPAPATYRLVSQVKNASFSILSVGDARPMEVLDEAGGQERYITYNEAGTFTVRFAAVNGKQLVEQTKTISVGPGNSSDPMAKLQVTYEAIRVETLPHEWHISCGWEGDPKLEVSPFRKERFAGPGCTIASAELVNNGDKNSPVRNVKLEIAPDKAKIILTGELRPTDLPISKSVLPPHWVAQVKGVVESRSPTQTINRGDVMMAISLNTPMKIPMQPLGPGWQIVRKQVSLQIWDGTRKVWEGSSAVSNTKVTLNNQSCFLTATPQNDAMVLRIDAPTMPIRPVGFERPVLPK